MWSEWRSGQNPDVYGVPLGQGTYDVERMGAGRILMARICMNEHFIMQPAG